MQASRFPCPNSQTAKLVGEATPASRGWHSLHKHRGNIAFKKIPLFFTKEGFALHQEEVYTHTFSIISVGIISQIRNIRKQHHFQHHPTKVYTHTSTFKHKKKGAKRPLKITIYLRTLHKQLICKRDNKIQHNIKSQKEPC